VIKLTDNERVRLLAKLRARKWRKNNPERLKEINRDYYYNNLEKCHARTRDYYSRNKKTILENQKPKRRELAVEIRKKVLEKLGNKCVRCGETDWRCLQIDHINGSGSKLRRQFKTAYDFYKFILEELNSGKTPNELGIQCLCANCNWRKRYENKELLIHYAQSV
jgi:hypothetical protein